MIEVPIATVIQQFHHAHQAVLDELGGSGRIIKNYFIDGSHHRILKEAWKKVHDVDIDLGRNGEWRYLRFKDEDDYLLWLIKYSG